MENTMMRIRFKPTKQEFNLPKKECERLLKSDFANYEMVEGKISLPEPTPEPTPIATKVLGVEDTPKPKVEIDGAVPQEDGNESGQPSNPPKRKRKRSSSKTTPKKPAEAKAE